MFVAGRRCELPALTPESYVRLFESREDDRQVDVQADVPEDAEVGAQVEDVGGLRVLEVRTTWLPAGVLLTRA